MTRRRFAALAAAGAADAVWAVGRGGVSMAAPQVKTQPRPAPRGRRRPGVPVAVVPCREYGRDEVYRALGESLERIGFRAPRSARVLLKPNIIGQNTPGQAVTTHPSIVAACCRYFGEAGCRVAIGDSSAFYQGGGTGEAFVTSGMAAVAAEYGATLIPFETTRLRVIHGGRVLDPLYLTEAVFDHDLVVNLPKMKIHRLARVTGAVKNCYGCIPGGTKQRYHAAFQARSDYQEFWGGAIADVYQAVRPGLSVMDAVYGLDTDGPAATGEPRRTGCLLASRNGAALDVVACRIMDIDPWCVPALRAVRERGLVDPDGIVVLGEPPLVPYIRLPDIAPKRGLAKRLDDFIFSQFTVHPHVNQGRCDHCGICVQECAVQAIDMPAGGFPVIDAGNCIDCYCCSEYCSRGAIRLRGSVVNLLMRAARAVLRI